MPGYQNKLLNEKEKTHGDWSEGAEVFAHLIEPVLRHKHSLTDSQFKGLIMNALKVERILTGDANEADHWLDLSGYADVVRENLNTRRFGLGLALEDGPFKPPHLRGLKSGFQFGQVPLCFDVAVSDIQELLKDHTKWEGGSLDMQVFTRDCVSTALGDLLGYRAEIDAWKKDDPVRSSLMSRVLFYALNRDEEARSNLYSIMYKGFKYAPERLVSHLEGWLGCEHYGQVIRPYEEK